MRKHRTDFHGIEWLSVIFFGKLSSSSRIKKLDYDHGTIWSKVPDA
jgi:hypothetical protein